MGNKNKKKSQNPCEKELIKLKKEIEAFSIITAPKEEHGRLQTNFNDITYKLQSNYIECLGKKCRFELLEKVLKKILKRPFVVAITKRADLKKIKMKLKTLKFLANNYRLNGAHLDSKAKGHKAYLKLKEEIHNGRMKLLTFRVKELIRKCKLKRIEQEKKLHKEKKAIERKIKANKDAQKFKLEEKKRKKEFKETIKSIKRILELLDKPLKNLKKEGVKLEKLIGFYQKIKRGIVNVFKGTSYDNWIKNPSTLVDKGDPLFKMVKRNNEVPILGKAFVLLGFQVVKILSFARMATSWAKTIRSGDSIVIPVTAKLGGLIYIGMKKQIGVNIPSFSVTISAGMYSAAARIAFGLSNLGKELEKRNKITPGIARELYNLSQKTTKQLSIVNVKYAFIIKKFDECKTIEKKLKKELSKCKKEL